MKFQKRIKLLPGVTLNLSKSGLTVSIGPRGATLNVGGNRSKITVGAPGTGLSHTRALGRGKPELTGEPLPAKPPAKSRSGWVWLALGALFLLAILMH